MDTTVKEIATWTRAHLDRHEIRMGSKSSLYKHLKKQYGLSEFTVRNFHKGEKDNPTQNMLDPLVNAIRDMEAKESATG